MVEAAVFLIFPLCLAVAAFSDLFTMTIPHRVSLILAASFLLLTPLLGLSLSAIGMHLLGAAIVFVVCFGLFTANIMGGGDAKLLSAAGLWFGFGQPLLIFVTDVGFVGGLITLLILILRGSSSTILAMRLPVPSSILLAKKIPYGLAIAIGGLLAYPSSPLLLLALERLH